MPKARKYHTLLVREDGAWTREFGDYERGTVEYELEDYRDKGVRRSDLKIITTDDNDSAINAAVAKLNQN